MLVGYENTFNSFGENIVLGKSLAQLFTAYSGVDKDTAVFVADISGVSAA